MKKLPNNRASGVYTSGPSPKALLKLTPEIAAVLCHDIQHRTGTTERLPRNWITYIDGLGKKNLQKKRERARGILIDIWQHMTPERKLGYIDRSSGSDSSAKIEHSIIYHDPPQPPCLTPFGEHIYDYLVRMVFLSDNMAKRMGDRDPIRIGFRPSLWSLLSPIVSSRVVQDLERSRRIEFISITDSDWEGEFHSHPVDRFDMILQYQEAQSYRFSSGDKPLWSDKMYIVSNTDESIYYTDANCYVSVGERELGVIAKPNDKALRFKFSRMEHAINFFSSAEITKSVMHLSLARMSNVNCKPVLEYYEKDLDWKTQHGKQDVYLLRNTRKRNNDATYAIDELVNFLENECAINVKNSIEKHAKKLAL